MFSPPALSPPTLSPQTLSPQTLSPPASFASMPPSISGQSRSSANPTRPKRSQVSRACDWCRVHRIKCDSEQPCHNCRSRGGQCSTTGASEIRTLPHAFREIERLKRKVQELEQEVERRDRAAAATLPTPNRSPGSSALPTPGPMPLVAPIMSHQQSSLGDYELWREGDHEQRALAGLYISNGPTSQKQWFGPSSLFYFIGRMTSHLAAFMEHPPAEHTIHWTSTGRSFADAGLEPSHSLGDQGVSANDNYTFLTAMQEEYFLNFFWQSYHCSFQIVDEASFRELYRSLWTGSCKTRKPSALVDIILALCIQYDTACPPRRDGTAGKPATEADAKDTAIAGRWHYQRCQTLLISELETPTIATLQCHIFSAIYLCCGAFQNMAHSTLAIAVRTAHMLGLHLEPPQDLPRPERELRKRLWWTLYALESKTCMKLGRPWSAPMSDTTCSLPADDHQLAIQSGSAALAGGNVTWLTYTSQNTKLVLSVRNVYVAFFHEAARILSSSGAATIYDDPAVLEACAGFLKSSMSCLDAWTQGVPDALRSKRKRGGEPFSTDGSGLAIEAFAPLWLQRQRLFLELLYHNLCVVLYRPMVSFTPNQGAPITEACAIACVSHAMTMTQIIHQALSETDLLKGWHESFQWQWNAAITMIGFILAYPLSPSAAAARTAVSLAIQVFEIFGQHFAVGTRAAKVAGELMAKAELLLNSLQAELAGLSADPSDPVWHVNNSSNPPTGLPGTPGGGGPDPTAAAMLVQQQQQDAGFDGIQLHNVLTGTMDMTFSVDSFNSFEVLQGGGLNFPDIWTFAAEA